MTTIQYMYVYNCSSAKYFSVLHTCSCKLNGNNQNSKVCKSLEKHTHRFHPDEDACLTEQFWHQGPSVVGYLCSFFPFFLFLPSQACYNGP